MGDPHCKTIDGLYYDCQLAGVFEFIAISDTNSNVKATFEIPLGENFSIATGVTAQEGSSPIIGVTTDTAGTAVITIDGAPYLGGSASLTGLQLQVIGATTVKMLFNSGLEVYAQVWGFKRMDLSAFVMPTMDTTGLLGNNNGDDSDEQVFDYCTDPVFNLAIPDLIPEDVLAVRALIVFHTITVAS